MSRQLDNANKSFAKALRDIIPMVDGVQFTDEQFDVFAEALDAVIDARVSDALDREHGRGDYRYD